MTAGAELEIDRCRCGRHGAVLHILLPERAAPEWGPRDVMPARRYAVVECHACGTRGPEIKFEDGSDEAEFVAVCRWNRLMHRG